MISVSSFTIFNHCFDLKSSNYLKFDCFIILLFKLVAENLPTEQMDGLKKMFHDMDKDKNGSLSFQELKDGLTVIGDQPVADPDIQMFMEAVSTSYSQITL